jgi:hypothetical protein
MDPEGIKYVPLVIATIGVFVLCLMVLMPHFFRDGDDSNRSASDFAERINRPATQIVGPVNMLFNRWGVVLLISILAAVATYRTLPRLPTYYNPCTF